MRNILKRGFCVILTLLFLFALSGCHSVESSYQTDDAYKEEISEKEIPDEEIPDEKIPEEEVPEEEVPDEEIPDEEIPEVNRDAEQLRKELNEFHFQGLTFYLGKEYYSDGQSDTGAEYQANGSDDVYVYTIDMSSPDRYWSEIFDGDISSSKELADSLKEYYLESPYCQNIQVKSKHGVYYVWEVAAGEAAGEAMVVGCYVKEDFAWLLEIEIADLENATEDEIETFIDYATLGVID